MIYGIYPEKDTTIYENNYDLNTGLDQILELNKEINTATELSYNSRILMKFDLTNFSASIVSGEITNPKFYLRLFVSDAQEIPVAYTLEAHPLSGSWEMGVGKFEESPEIRDGATWRYRDTFNDQTMWYSGSASLAPGTTSSYASALGGGAWFTGSSATQSFNYENADVEMDVTDIVNSWLSGTFPNEGFLIKWTDSEEQSQNDLSSLKFFSKESHTIYLPKLEVRWDDSNFVTASVKNTFTSSISSSAVYWNELTYPTLSTLTFPWNYSVSSSLVHTATSASVSRIISTNYGTNLSGSVAIYDILGSFSGSYSGSLNLTNSSGLYSGSIKGYCTSNGTSIMYSSWTMVNSSLSGSFVGEFIGTFSGSLVGSANGYYEGNLNATYSGSVVTSSVALQVSTPGTEYYTTSSMTYFVTQSEFLKPLSNTGNIIVYLNGLHDYKADSKVRVNVLAREQYPKLKYVTESVNYQVHYLPTSSYYSIWDAHSEETIIDFDENYTKLSCDSSGSYFNFWVGLQPERNYRFRFKVVRGGLEEYFDNGFYFKVKR